MKRRIGIIALEFAYEAVGDAFAALDIGFAGEFVAEHVDAAFFFGAIVLAALHFYVDAVVKGHHAPVGGAVGGRGAA